MSIDSVGYHTVFMGCSVMSFGMNLGWGSEASSCTIKLVKDYSAAYASNKFSSFKTHLDNIKGRTDYEEGITVSQALKNVNDPTKILQRNILEEFRNNKVDTTFAANGSEEGKKIWATDSETVKYWKYKDPGFVGDYIDFEGNKDIDIVGCLCYFQYESTWFGGLIKSWKNTSEGTYEVELQSVASLLGGCQLILKKYYGTVSTEIPNTTDIWGEYSQRDPGGNLSMPYGFTKNYTDGISWDCSNKYATKIAQGNIPNLLNIFGYMENISFGNSLFDPSIDAVSAGKVYDTLVELLSNEDTRTENAFNPYGAIVAKTPMQRHTINRTTNELSVSNSILNTSDTINLPRLGSQTIKLTELGFPRTVLAVDNVNRTLLRLNISEVPRPPNGAYLNNDKMSILEFINYCCTEAGYDFFIDFIPYTDTSSVYSGEIVIRTISRNIQPYPNIIKNFIRSYNDTNKVISYSLGEEFDDTETRSVLVGGPQQRLVQLYTNTWSVYRFYRAWEPSIDNYVDLSALNNATQARENEKLNGWKNPDSANTNPFDSQSDHGPWAAVNSGGVTAQIKNNFWTNTEQDLSRTTNTMVGNYFPMIRPALGNNLTGSYPLYLDIISPFFGLSNNNKYRKVYVDTLTRQLQIVFDFSDIADFFPTPFAFDNSAWPNYNIYDNRFPEAYNAGGAGATGAAGGAVGFGQFVVTETELRYAIGGERDSDPFEQWWRYTLYRVQHGYPTSLAKILHNFLSRYIDIGFANNILFPNGRGKLEYFMWLQMFYHNSPPWMGKTMAYAQRAEIGNKMWEYWITGIDKLLRDIHGFLKNIGDIYYGKQYSIRIPNPNTYINSAGTRIYDYEITDGGWEDPGTTIDNVVQIGSIAADSLKNDDGKFGFILGFNASAEKMPTDDFFNSTNMPSLNRLAYTDYILFQRGFQNLFKNNYYWPLTHRLPGNSFLLMPYGSYITKQNLIPDGYDNSLGEDYSAFNGGVISHYPNETPAANYQYKLYVKGQIESFENYYDNKQILYVDNTARVVVGIPNPVHIKSNDGIFPAALEILLWDKWSDQSPPSLTNPLNVSISLPIPTWASTSDIRWLGIVWMLIMNRNITDRLDITSGVSNRAATPNFACLPVKLNLMTYGPWVSHPGIIASHIFPAANPNDASYDPTPYVNNLTGGVSFEVDTSLVPWEYNGMNALNNAATLKVSNNSKYQRVLEAGSITFAGLMYPGARIGSRFLSANGPLVTSMNVNVGDSVNVTYNMKTYSRKIGFFNKEAADNIKRFTKELMLRDKTFANKLREINNKILYNR